MSKTLVSCVMPTTAARLHFATQALHYFRSQTHENRELVIVTDATQEALNATHRLGVDIASLNIKVSAVKFVVAPVGATIGAKLNAGCNAAKGRVIHRWDDDDWYHPEAVERSIAELGRNALTADGLVVAPGTYYSLDVARWELRRQGPDCFPGGMLCFLRSTWRDHPFREDLETGEDVAFRRGLFEKRMRTSARVAPYVLVRHGANTWREQDGISVEDHLSIRGTLYDAGPEGFFNPSDLGFYAGLRTRMGYKALTDEEMAGMVSAT